MDSSVIDDMNDEERSSFAPSDIPMLKKSPEKSPKRKMNIEMAKTFFKCDPADLCICMSSLSSIKDMPGGHVL